MGCDSRNVPADQLHELAVSLGGVSLKAPYDTFWGLRYGAVEGPGALVVGLMSIADPQRRTAGPDPSELR